MSWDGDSWETEAEEFFETDGSNYAAERLLYDAAGNLTYDGEYQYTFDAWNRLVKVERAWRDSEGDLATGSVVALLAYDGRGRRIEKEIQNSADWTATYHYYYSRGWQVLEERNGSDQVLRQYVWGARYVDNPIQIGINTDPSDSSEGPGENQCLVEEFYWPVQDGNFNVLGLVASDGTLHERYEYTPYGERTVYMRAGSADEKTSAPLYESQRVNTGTEQDPEWAPYGLCDFGHQGLALDKEFGQYYNRSRQYLPRAARFLNRDPAGYSDGMSLYQYVGSGPLGALDPMGLSLIGPGDAPTPWNPNPGEDDESGAKTQKSSVDKLLGDCWDGKLTFGEFMKRFGKMSREEKEEFTRRAEEEFGRRGGGEPGRVSRVVPGGGAWSWKRGGLKDYGNPFWNEDASYAEIFSGTTDSEMRRGLQWERDYERQTGRSAADNLDDYNKWYMLRRNYEAYLRNPGTTILTEGVGSDDYLAVGSIVVGLPKAIGALEPQAAKALAWGLPKAKAAYVAGMTMATKATILMYEFAQETRPGQFAGGVLEGSVPGPVLFTDNPWYNAGLCVGQKIEEVPQIIPAAWDALIGREGE